MRQADCSPPGCVLSGNYWPLTAQQLPETCPVDAKQLAAKGAQLVEADAADAGQLRAAFEAAYGVFAVTVALGGGEFADAYQNELKQGAPYSAGRKQCLARQQWSVGCHLPCQLSPRLRR